MQMYKVKDVSGSCPDRSARVLQTPFSCSIARMTEGKATTREWGTYILSEFGKDVTRSFVVAHRIKGDAHMHRTELENGDIVVVAVLPQGVTKKGGALLETISFDNAMEEASPELHAAALSTYLRVVGDRKIPTRRLHPELEPSAVGTPGEGPSPGPPGVASRLGEVPVGCFQLRRPEGAFPNSTAG